MNLLATISTQWLCRLDVGERSVDIVLETSHLLSVLLPDLKDLRHACLRLVPVQVTVFIPASVCQEVVAVREVRHR